MTREGLAVNTSAYERLLDELDRTAVVSEDFKRVLRGYAAAIAREAYDRGVANAREAAARDA